MKTDFSPSARTNYFPLSFKRYPALRPVVLLATCGVILFLRRPDALTNPQFWAEDGFFFTRERILGLGALLESYNGYLHTIPRIVAAIASWFDPGLTPAIYVGAAVSLTLYTAARTQSRRFPLAPHFGYALAVVVIPDMPDGLMNITNVQSILAAALVLILISKDPISPGEWCHDLIDALLLGLTGPFAVLFAPFFFWRALSRKTKASWTLASLVAFSAVVQLRLIVLHPVAVFPPTGPQIFAPYYLAYPGCRIGASLFAGRFFPSSLSLVAMNILGVLTLALVAWLALRLPKQRENKLMLAGCFVALMASVIYRLHPALPQFIHFGQASRYFYAPQLIVLWLVIDGVARRGLGSIYGLLLALFLFVNVPRLREPALEDLHWANFAPSLRTGEAVEIPVNPTGWKYSIPARKDE